MMRPVKHLPVFFSAASTVILLAPPCFADDFADGKKLYAARDYNKAAECFNRGLQKNQRSADLHYYLANCYVAKRDFAEAKSEYQYAANLTHDEKVRDYCMTVIASLDARSQVSHQSSSSHDDYKPGMAYAQRIIDNTQQEANKVFETADRQIRAVQDERAAALAPMSGLNRAMVPVTTPEEKENVTAPYDQRMDAIRKQAQARVNEITERGTRAAQRVAQ